jgi:hypothetical protein
MPEVLRSGLLDGVNAVTEQGAHLMPYRGRIIRAYARVRVVAGTAGYEVRVGKQGDDDYFGDETIATTDAAGTIVEIPLDQTVFEKNDVITFAADGGATGTGSCDVVVIVEPLPPA